MNGEMKRRGTGLAVALGIADILLLAGLLLLFLGDTGPEKIPRDPAAQRFAQTDMTEEERLRALSDALGHMHYNPEPVLRNGTADLYLSNGEESGCMLSAEIMRLETGDVIGSVGLIGPGYRLEYMECAAGLPAGEHACLMTVCIYDENGMYIGRAGRHLMLTAE